MTAEPHSIFITKASTLSLRFCQKKKKKISFILTVNFVASGEYYCLSQTTNEKNKTLNNKIKMQNKISLCFPKRKEKLHKINVIYSFPGFCGDYPSYSFSW
jgi:hypothetical protein